MNRLTIAVLLFAIAQVHSSPVSKRNWQIVEPIQGYDGQIKIKDEDKKDNNLDLGDYNDQEKEKDYYYHDKEGKKGDSKEKEKDKDLKSEDENLKVEASKAVNSNVMYGEGEDIVAGDIKMTSEQAALFKHGGWDGLVKSSSWKLSRGKWSRTIPYTITGVGSNEVNALYSSIEMFHQHTCLRFVPKSYYNHDYLKIVSQGGCWSYIGKVGSGAQNLSLGIGCIHAVPAHEIMHALGRYHEQMRADRDHYVRIVPANINSTFMMAFYRMPKSDSQSLPYDYLSVMHYGKYTYSINGQPTIIPIPDASVTIGQIDRMTQYDIQHVNIRYCPERALRLVGGSGSFEGRVEVFWNEQWGTVCDDGFEENDGRVICKYLGFPDVVATYHGAHFGQGAGRIIMDDLNCAGHEYSPFACPMRAIGTHNCGHQEDASVTCQKNVRLVGGIVSPTYASGRLEVYVEGQWGTVCDDLIDINSANVACRQLGYERAKKVYQRAHYGQGTLPILMDDVSCFGYEAQLSHCRSNPIGEHNCHHNEDVGISCANY